VREFLHLKRKARMKRNKITKDEFLNPKEIPNPKFDSANDESFSRKAIQRHDHTAIYRKERGVYAASTFPTQRFSKFTSTVVDLCNVKRRKRRAPMSWQLHSYGLGE